jgi:Outer membrane lipoprotein-sorting protein
MRGRVCALAVCLLLPFGAQMGHAQTALIAARQQVESADYRLNGRLVRVDANGVRTTDNLQIKARWFPGVLRILLEITSPAAARAHVLLEVRADGRSTIRIAHPGDAAATELPFSKWMEEPLGEAFSYEDFLDAQYFWASQKDLGQGKFGARICDQLLSTPGPGERSHYASVKSWLDPTSGFPVYVEKQVKDSEDLKQFTFFGLRKTRNVWWASQVEAKIRGRAGSTLFIVDRGSPQAHLGLQDFDSARLTHF